MGNPFQEGYDSGYEAGYRSTYGIGLAVGGLIGSGMWRRLFGPVIGAGLLGLILAITGVNGNANPDFFAIVSGVIPTLGLAIFIVVDRNARGGVDATEQLAKSQALWYYLLGWGLGFQLLLGEVASLYAVASQSKSRTLALIVGAVVVVEIMFLVRYTFGLMQPEDVGARVPTRDHDARQVHPDPSH